LAHRALKSESFRKTPISVQEKKNMFLLFQSPKDWTSHGDTKRKTFYNPMAVWLAFTGVEDDDDDET
jgi:hypothetical protein